MKLIFFALLSCFIFSSCMFSTSSNPVQKTAEVYQYDHSIQCKPDTGIALHEMKQKLIDESIEVISSRKGSDGKMRVSVCGSLTGKINIYKIDEKDVEKAEKLGFNRLSEINK